MVTPVKEAAAVDHHLMLGVGMGIGMQKWRRMRKGVKNNDWQSER